MTRALKKTFFILLCAFAFLCAGFFFVGCDVDASKINLTAETNYVEMGVGDEVDVYFNLTNYKKGFSNIISVSERTATGEASAGDQGSIFSVSEVTHVTASRMKVTIKGLHGGSGTIYAKTLQGGKECLIDIHVFQYSTMLEEGSNTLYITNNAEFTPSPTLFTFEPYTTEKELSYYYFTPRSDFNFNTYYLDDVNEETQSVSFTDGIGGFAEGAIVKFDKSWLSDDNKIVLSYNGEIVEKPFVDDFYMLSVYDYSVDNENYEKILYAISTIHVLPSLDVAVSGGYLVGENVNFSPLDDNAKIKIVPNNSKMRTYIIKLEVAKSLRSSAVEIEKITDGTNYLDIDVAADFVETGVETDNLVYYWKVSQNSQAQVETEFGFKIFYNIAQDISVENVNFEINFIGDLEIAPLAITINGTTEPEKITLYNSYGSSSFGWKELLIGVISGYNVSPSFEGIYFEYDNSKFDITYDGVTVGNGDGRLYDNLNKPFYIKGKNVEQTTANVKIHLRSDILQDADELTQEIECEIVSGARIIEKDFTYRTQDVFYLDINGGEQDFSVVAYADEKFQSMTYLSTGLNDIVKITFDDAHPYIEANGVYYLNIKVTPLAVGDSSYRIYLDNGVSKDFAFRTIKTLQPDSTSIRLADSGNSNVTNMSYSRYDAQSVFDDVLNIEVLNASDSSRVVYGSVANVVITANVTSIDYTLGNTDNAIIVSQTSVIANSSNVNYRITTAKNGNTPVTFNLRGTDVENFNTTDVSEAVYLNVSSYSLITEFNVKRGSGFANENIVYFGENANDEDKSLTFSINANNQEAFNFYRYALKEAVVADIYESDVAPGTTFEIGTDKIDEPTLVNEKFARKFVYFYAQRQNGRSYVTYTNVSLTKNNDESSRKVVQLGFTNGLMFVGSDFEYVQVDEFGAATGDTYQITFTNSYIIGDGFGTFDLESLTYVVGKNSTESSVVVIRAYLSQRSSTQSYNMTIRPTKFIPVESISLASNLTKLNFSNSKLTYTFGVYTYPTYSTNKNIFVEFVRTKVNPTAADKYLDLLTYKIDMSNSSNGVYTITLSCEEFYRKHMTDIHTIEDALTGIVYIYPSEWGNSYTTIVNNSPIVLEIQYRNGSKANPYLIESADDISNMNANEVMLKSSYEIGSVVDVATLTNATPIGILDNEVVGFSGTIIGSSSQALIKNILISETNFSAVVGETNYAGLFAKVNKGAVIENVSFAGSINFENVTTNIEAGLLAAENDGQLVNVGVTLDKSSLKVTRKTAKVGGLVGVNAGEIYQDFMRYNGQVNSTSSSGSSNYAAGYHYNHIGTSDSTKHVDEDGYEIDDLGRRIVYEYVYDEYGEPERDSSGQLVLKALPTSWDYSGQKSKILAYYNDKFEIETDNSTIYVGGVAGRSYGLIERFLADSTYKMYGYSAYTAYALIYVSGTTTLGGKIMAGGIVGEIYTKETGKSSTLDGTLVGGEVDTSVVNGNASDFDNVGGIAGRIEGDEIAIRRNTSRVFLRANKNVGGIVGQEIVSQETIANFGSENVIENVDDGRGAFYAAMIINYQPEPTINASFRPAIGSTTRDNDVVSRFETRTYLQRSWLNSAAIDKNNAATDVYYGDYICVAKDDYSNCKKYQFTLTSVEVDFDGNNKLSGEGGVDVYFMYYYAVDGMLSDADNATSQTIAQDSIAGINYIGPSNGDYPFVIRSQDVNILSANQNILSIDTNGFITIKSTGLCVVTLSSILNINITQKNYIYVVNYFNKDVDTSIYYSSPSSNGRNLNDGTYVTIYGNQSATIYVVPNYSAEGKQTTDGDRYSITDNGILSYQNVLYVLSKNAYITSTADKVLDSHITRIQINKQSIIFHKDEADVDHNDVYMLTPTLSLSVLIDGRVYQYVYKLEDAKTEIHTAYKETATAINVHYRDNAIRTNNPFRDYVTITSTNPDEKLFYQIFKKEENGNIYLMQNKMPESLADVESYAIEITNKDLFNLVFTKRAGQNIFDYSCSVNTDSDAFINRFKEPIYGDYVVYLYASELEDGVSAYFNIRLDEASVNYIVATNYSNIRNVSVADEVVVPAQDGLIEVSVDPIEAIFDTFTISNNVMNLQPGSGQAKFTFVYEKDNQGTISYEYGYSFVTSDSGSITFTYQKMIEYLKNVGAVDYKGKVYIGYFVASNNVEDAIPVAFDISVTYGEEEVVSTTIEMVTKLSSYAKLVFNNKDAVDDSYYVARGLSYGMTLQYYGFTENQISITSTDASVAVVSGGDGRYTLAITSNAISYNDVDPGYKILITTSATKEVDGVTISTSSTITIYVMEYVLNYIYEDGVNRDIVSGMKNGVIDDAIGNPYTLSMDLSSFVEYDRSNRDVSEELSLFLRNLTANTKFVVHYNETEELLEQNKTIRTDYYLIKSLSVTPLKLYNAESGIYHFSVSAQYSRRRGVYVTALDSAYKIYSEFSFDVHNQSTENSPIPVETYTDLMGMSDGEWYILVQDISIPDDMLVSIGMAEAFVPINASIKGLDGNGHSILFGGNYSVDATNFGLFEKVYENTILKNIAITIASDVNINLSVSNYNVGLLAAENEGVITNCSVKAVGNAPVSVLSTQEASGSYVAGIAASNTGFITNSQVSVNIKTNANLAGLVGQNSGLIASSYYKGASLENTTGTVNEYIAGIAVLNSGRIYTSYVSGDTSKCEGDAYYSETENALTSSNNLAGFVYSNSGDISDCYSNIKINSGAYASGFVFENSGNILRCFSTSVLTSEQTSNYGFIYRNSISSKDGLIKHAYYLAEKSNEENIDINQSIGEITPNENTDLTKLTRAGFADMSKFADYIVSSTRTPNSIWFYNSANNETFNGAKFNTGRIELVAPNIIATSERELDHIESVVDSETGAAYVNYIYVYKDGYPALGSIYNPILIYDYQTMEDYIVSGNNNSNFNYNYYRLISDIDYADNTANSKTYKTRFVGYFEGNFMSISGISMMSDESLQNAGLFAEIGSTISSAEGTVMNFTLKPKSVSFVETCCVGTIAGRINGGTLINVNVESDGEQIVVNGKNIVGGVVGCATGNYKMINVYSTIGAKARRQNIKEGSNDYDETAINYENYSFAGSYAGVVSGNGAIRNVQIQQGDVVSVLADKAGLVFGFVDKNVSVENVEVNVDARMIVNAYRYGGFVAGEIKGMMTNVAVIGNGGNFENFKKEPFMPAAIGGIAGLIDGGTLTNVTMTQSIKVASESDSDGVPNLGGIAGIIKGNAYIMDAAVKARLIGFVCVGGVAGTLDANEGQSNFMRMFNLDVNLMEVQTSGRELKELYVGGVAGKVSTGVALQVAKNGDTRNTIAMTNISIKTYVYNDQVDIYLGAIAGRNVSTESFYISYVDSTIQSGTNGIIQAYEMSVQNAPNTATCVNGVINKPEGTDDEPIEINYLASEFCTISCNITYSYPHITAAGATNTYKIHMLECGAYRA